MAVLWSRQRAGVTYEVRGAGRTRRLYTDGVLHSQFNPSRPVTGSVWDLLMLPAFFPGPERIRRALVLGIGGGTVLHQIRRYLAPDTLLGVELDPVHIQIARRFFGVDEDCARIHHADAIQFVRDYAGPPFDLIIDDLFAEREGEPVRAVAADLHWVRALLRLRARGGIVVANFPDRRELLASAYQSAPAIARRFKSRFELTTPYYENAIGAFLAHDYRTRDLRTHLKGHPELDPQRRNSGLRFRIRRLPASA